MTTLLDAIVAITAIVAVFGMLGFIIIKILQLIRDWIVSRRQPASLDELTNKIELYEQRQEQLLKRVQHLETMMVDTHSGHSETTPKSRVSDTEKDLFNDEEERPLKNKLR